MSVWCSNARRLSQIPCRALLGITLFFSMVLGQGELTSNNPLLGLEINLHSPRKCLDTSAVLFKSAAER